MKPRYKIITEDSRFQGQVCELVRLHNSGDIILLTSVGAVPYFAHEVVLTTEELTPLNKCDLPMWTKES